MGLSGSILDQLDQIGDWGLLATDADLIVTRWNRWLEQRSGLAATEVVGRALFDLFPDLLTRRIDRYYHQVLAGQTAILSHRFHKYVIQLPVADASGQTHLQQTSRIVPLLDGTTVCGTLTLIEDVTERVAYEAELRSRVHQQSALAAAARSALGGHDTVDVARDVARHIRETLDADFVEVLELSPDLNSWNCLAASGWPGPTVRTFETTSAARVKSVLVSDNTVTAVELSPDQLAEDSYLRSHGVVDGLIFPIPGRDRPFGFLGVYARSHRRFPPAELLFAQASADVLGVAAERKRLERELQLRVDDLADMDRRKDEFLAMLAHELRNPLAPVQNGLHILRVQHNANPEVNRLAEMMSRQVSHLVRLVDDLLDVSRITQGKVVLRNETVDLNEVVAQATETARPLIDARRQELSINTGREPIVVHADASRLAQVIGNLLNNAIKYTDEGGRIWLQTRREGDKAVVSVRDTGAGIAAEMLPKVFDLFTQVDRTLDRAKGGLGVGLTLVRSLVELHGGTVHASSPGPGRGSEFVIQLPAAPRTAGVGAKAGEPKSVPLPSSPCRILIVDDNVDAADSLAMLLKFSGHQTWTAYRGPAALELVARHRPQVILLDIGLPGMDGYEVARQLRSDPMGSVVTLVALTGYGQDDDRRKTHDAGFDYHFVKPIQPNELLALLAKIECVRPASRLDSSIASV